MQWPPSSYKIDYQVSTHSFLYISGYMYFNMWHVSIVVQVYNMTISANGRKFSFDEKRVPILQRSNVITYMETENLGEELVWSHTIEISRWKYGLLVCLVLSNLSLHRIPTSDSSFWDIHSQIDHYSLFGKETPYTRFKSL